MKFSAVVLVLVGMSGFSTWVSAPGFLDDKEILTRGLLTLGVTSLTTKLALKAETQKRAWATCSQVF